MRGDRAIPALVFTAAFAAYLNAFNGSFQFDDFNVIVDCPPVRSLAAWFSDLSSGMRPLLKLTYCLNYLFGPSPWGFHLFNNLVHALSALLVYLLSLRVFGRDSSRYPALACALLFALHPVRTEAVTYVSSRSVSLAALFMLLSVYSYARGREGSAGHQNVASPLWFILAVAVRETSVILPLLLMAWEVHSGGTMRSGLARARTHWALCGLALAYWLLKGGPFLIYVQGLLDFDGPSLFLRQANGVFYLLTRWLNPFTQNIDPDLPDAVAWTAPVTGEVVVLTLMLGGGLAALRLRHPAGLGFVWFFLNLAPTNSFLPRFDVASERHLYLAALGLEWALVASLWPLASRRPRVAAIVGGVVLLALVAGVAARNMDYRSEISLWEDTARKSPGKARAQNNLGYAYLAAGELLKALERFELALKLDPANANAGKNLEIVNKRMGIR